MLKIHLLGNGGCVHSGLPHINFLINDKFLVELPPDVMQSLANNKIHKEKIEKVFISHFHGDHFFGAPFFLINRHYSPEKKHFFPTPQLMGPVGLLDKLEKTIELSFGEKSSLIEKLPAPFEIIEVNENSKTIMDNKWNIRFFPVNHIPHTYGFFIEKTGDEHPRFAYIPDTSWGDNVKKVLKECPKIVFCDMNGSGGHLSVDDILHKALPITGEQTCYYGIHIYKTFASPHHLIQPTQAGEVLIIQ